MLLSGRDRPIRILVDHYHDSGWHNAGDLAGGPCEVTICRRRLTWGLLKRYHLLIIDASTPAPFAATELKAVERLVAEGGGLLLAASAPTFELMADAPAAQMPANALAQRFGFRFLSPFDCQAAPRYDRNFRLGYPGEHATVRGGAPCDFGPHAPRVDTWAPLATPASAQVLLEHPDTGEALAALAQHGAGRVAVCGTRLRGLNFLAHLHPLMAWLAESSTQRPGRGMPFEVGPLPKLHKVRRLRLIAEEPLEAQIDQIAEVIDRFASFMTDLLGDAWETPERIELARTCGQPHPWEDLNRVGAAVCSWALAYNVAYTLALQGLGGGHHVDLLITIFPEFTILRHLAIRFVEHMGFADQARRLRDIAAQMVDEADPDRTGADLARVYWATDKWHPKGMWLAAELERRYGDDFLGRLMRLIPKKRDEEKLPQNFAWPSDRMAHYLSLAAGEDLSPWLAQIGTTVHPLPLVKQGEEQFGEAMRRTLAAGATTGPASRRMDALADLAALPPEEREKLPSRVRGLVEAFGRAAACDPRASRRLRTLSAQDGPAGAIASLQLLSMGHTDAAERLAAVAPSQDVRFRLMAGHLLQKVGVDVPELTLMGLVEDKEPVGELTVDLRDSLDIHCRIEGYEVANVISERRLTRFPHGNYASCFYVYWVHTLPQWRRSGLSRLAFTAAMEHEEAQRCSTFSLNTGRRNNAHAMYADFGFVDVQYFEEVSKSLTLGTPCAPPDGVVIRPMGDDDREAVRGFLLAHLDRALQVVPVPAPRLGEATRVSLAEKDGALVGAAVGMLRDEGDARVAEVAVTPDTGAAGEIGVALLAALHQLLAAEGARTARAWIQPEADAMADALARAGYSRRTSGGVTMFGIRDLGHLLTEVRPLYERRLADAELTDRTGRVMILGDRLRAGLEIEGGSVRVVGPEPRPTDIVLRTTDETITRFVVGRETPLEGYLQRRSDIEPQVSAQVMKLLETLFPQHACLVRWQW
ncbi:MAG: hypothetical protein AB7Y46_08925 [Armatimonadota bacterium]